MANQESTTNAAEQKNAPAKERPLLFSAPMIRAVLSGRKTVTRRLGGLGDVNAYPGALDGECGLGPLGYRGLSPSDYYIRDKRGYAKNPKLYHWFVGQHEGEINPIPVKCPYGAVGDRLWVKETWCPYGGHVLYRANYGQHTPIDDGIGGPWKPSIFMPRAASRITLEITSIRAERLQSITEADALAEGVELLPCTYVGQCRSNSCPRHGVFDPGRRAFEKLWDSINGKTYPWESDPFVWAVSFRRLEGGAL